MLSIQDVGLSILGDNPGKFYILGGVEYGIKDKYIEILTSKVGTKVEYGAVQDVINLMSKYHIIPLPPQVYVIRYDKSFLSDLNKDLAAKVLSLNIIGTLVLIYEDTKDIAKLDKFFPDNTASIDLVDVKHLNKYLRSDFPELDKKTIESVTKLVGNYYQAKTICNCLMLIQDKAMLTERQIATLFGIQPTYTNEDIQIAVADRNFNSLVYLIEHYDGDLQNVLYQILRVMIELDKCLDGKYVKSPLKSYAKKWTKPDIYYMFNHTYEAVKALRSGYMAEIDDLIVYLGALMMFKRVPDVRSLR